MEEVFGVLCLYCNINWWIFQAIFSVLDWWLNHFHIAHRSDVKSENIYLPIQFILINGQKVRVEGMYVKRINVFAF